MLADPGDDAEAPEPTLDRFDLEIVEFMLTWAPYGGPTEQECMPLFGMTPARLEIRFRTIVRTGQRRWLSEDDYALLECQQRAMGGEYFTDNGYRTADVALAGGAGPLRVRGSLIGAVGVSGLAGERDHYFVFDAMRTYAPAAD
jgi:hypothetical protein